MWPIYNLNQALAFLHDVRIVHDSVDGTARSSARQELERFYLVHARTYLRTLEVIRRAFPAVDRPLRVLELGASPYFFTALLSVHFPCEITASTVPVLTWPGENLDITSQPVTISRGNSHEALDVATWTFNIETDLFPFPDDSFDLVLCMEVMEHLTYSPTHTLVEAHRVLRPGGRLVITIPNYLRANRIVQLLLGRPDDFPYVGTGIQGRHQREMTAAELGLLLDACTYRVDVLETVMVWPWNTTTSLAGRVFNALLRGGLDLPFAYSRNRRELVIASATPFGEPRFGYPSALYDDPAAFPHSLRPVERST